MSASSIQLNGRAQSIILNFTDCTSHGSQSNNDFACVLIACADDFIVKQAEKSFLNVTIGTKYSVLCVAHPMIIDPWLKVTRQLPLTMDL